MSYTVTLPTVLRKLKWDRDVRPADFVPLTIPDGREILDQYFRKMELGARYERDVQAAWNTSTPGAITEQNLRTSTLLRSRGWSHTALAGIVGRALPELQRIPSDADLLVTDTYDCDAISVMVRLCRIRGVQAANATKFLYQKRPALFPIIDSQARRALGLGWFDTHEEFFRACLARSREVAMHADNARALSAIGSWAASEPAWGHGMRLSRIRVLDIPAWMQTYARAYYGLKS